MRAMTVSPETALVLFSGGQDSTIVGNAWMVLVSIPLVAYLRRRDERIGLTAALIGIP